MVLRQLSQGIKAAHLKFKSGDCILESSDFKKDLQVTVEDTVSVYSQFYIVPKRGNGAFERINRRQLNKGREVL